MEELLNGFSGIRSIWWFESKSVLFICDEYNVGSVNDRWKCCCV